MSTKIKNLALSLLYIHLIVIGQFIGNVLGVFLLSILGKEYWFSFILNYLSEIAFMLIGGIIGGIFAGYTIIKFFKSFLEFMLLNLFVNFFTGNRYSPISFKVLIMFDKFNFTLYLKILVIYSFVASQFGFDRGFFTWN